jgi:hypothetical protein
VVKDSRPPVPEDRATREVRRISVAQKKGKKDAAKMCQIRKALEREALNKRRRQQRLDGLPVEESPSKTASEEDEDEDSDDNDVGSRYDAVTFQAHLPVVQPLLEPISEGSTSQASRVVSAPIEGEEEPAKGRAREGPSKRGSIMPGVPKGMSVVPRPRVCSPRTSSTGETTMSMPEARVPSSGVRTRGQTASLVQRTPGTSSAQAPRSARSTGGLMEGPSQKPSSGSRKPEMKPPIPLSW